MPSTVLCGNHENPPELRRICEWIGPHRTTPGPPFRRLRMDGFSTCRQERGNSRAISQCIPPIARVSGCGSLPARLGTPRSVPCLPGCGRLVPPVRSDVNLHRIHEPTAFRFTSPPTWNAVRINRCGIGGELPVGPYRRGGCGCVCVQCSFLDRWLPAGAAHPVRQLPCVQWLHWLRFLCGSAVAVVAALLCSGCAASREQGACQPARERQLSEEPVPPTHRSRLRNDSLMRGRLWSLV